MAILSLVRFVCILYGMLFQHDHYETHNYTIYPDFLVIQRNIYRLNDTNSFHYFHKNL